MFPESSNFRAKFFFIICTRAIYFQVDVLHLKFIDARWTWKKTVSRKRWRISTSSSVSNLHQEGWEIESKVRMRRQFRLVTIMTVEMFCKSSFMILNWNLQLGYRVVIDLLRICYAEDIFLRNYITFVLTIYEQITFRWKEAEGFLRYRMLRHIIRVVRFMIKPSWNWKILYLFFCYLWKCPSFGATICSN